MRRLPAAVLLTTLAAMAGCADKDRAPASKAPPGEYVPTMITDSVSTLVSDSGYTRYHITAPLWLMYEDAPDPYWLFPEGLELEQYDSDLRPAAHVRCDSARYFSRRRLWRLDGHVLMVNTLRDSFATEQVFWDQTRQMVYSDSFIHIVRQEGMINGYGFESNQDMTAYTVNRPTGLIPAQRPSAPTERADTAPARTAGNVRPSQRHQEPVIAPPVKTRPGGMAIKQAEE